MSRNVVWSSMVEFETEVHRHEVCRCSQQVEGVAVGTSLWDLQQTLSNGRERGGRRRCDLEDTHAWQWAWS